MIRFRRYTGTESVTVSINAGEADAAVSFPEEKLYWAEGFQIGVLSPGGFAVTFR